MMTPNTEEETLTPEAEISRLTSRCKSGTDGRWAAGSESRVGPASSLGDKVLLDVPESARKN